MYKPRVIPSLLLRDESIVKTIKFNKFRYIGDPCNTVRIFNELEVDELFINDILASTRNQIPNFTLLKDIANECFMPLAYGGGIKDLDDAKKIFDIGFEKILINTNAIIRPSLISAIANQYGSQAVVTSIDVKKTFLNGKKVFNFAGKNNTKLEPLLWAKEVEKRGAGEILLTSIDNEGTWKGFDIELTLSIANQVSIPVVAQGGAGSINDIKKVLSKGKASAVALGSMVCFQKKGMGVLINFPDKDKIDKIFNNIKI